jgi:hypothetical protein
VISNNIDKWYSRYLDREVANEMVKPISKSTKITLKPAQT